MMTKFITAWALWLLATVAIASDSLNLSIEKWLYNDDIQAENAQLDIKFTMNGLALTLTADRIILPPPIGRVSNIDLKCSTLLLSANQYNCKKGELSFVQSELGKQKVQFQLLAQPELARYHLIISDLKIADASLNLEIDWKQSSDWRVVVDSTELTIETLLTKLNPYLSDAIQQQLSNWDIAGKSNLHGKLEGQGENFYRAEVNLSAREINFSDSSGQYVSEQLALQLAANFEQQEDHWLWQANLVMDGGQAYAEPIFLDLAQAPLSLNGKGKWQPQQKRLVVSDFDLEQPKVIHLSGQLSLDDKIVSNADIELASTALSPLYKTWLQPFTMGTAIDTLELAGQVKLHYHQSNDNYQLQLGLDEVFIDDQAQRFGIDDLSGKLAWTNTDDVMINDVNWQGGYVYAIPIGASSIRAEVASSSLRLTQAWNLPILDGELQLNQLVLHHPEGQDTTWSFDGLLTPISMESLSTALDWPLLHGKLSGVIPKVTYADQKIEVDGALMVKLFDGTTVIRDLRLTKPFGALPQLYGNIDLVGLDLETLTRTFDFGKITGKLDGTVKNLRLSNWQPVQFDARFVTPEGDKSRRKISQRAVDNLSQIGGGASGVLSRSFLRFFEDFSYQRLGLSCHLMNNVCDMSGVGDAETGYYIVKGGGLPPRINVVGYTRRVDWSDLIERLKAVQNSSGPVVQ